MEEVLVDTRNDMDPRTANLHRRPRLFGIGISLVYCLIHLLHIDGMKFFIRLLSTVWITLDGWLQDAGADFSLLALAAHSAKAKLSLSLLQGYGFEPHRIHSFCLRRSLPFACCTLTCTAVTLRLRLPPSAATFFLMCRGLRPDDDGLAISFSHPPTPYTMYHNIYLLPDQLGV
eukprot:COSAG01_NODE_17672_length_1132_cov_1.885770_2_plen_174_part_00